MYPWYQGLSPNYELPEDDRHGIQQMYGKCIIISADGLSARARRRICFRELRWISMLSRVIAP